MNGTYRQMFRFGPMETEDKNVFESIDDSAFILINTFINLSTACPNEQLFDILNNLEQTLLPLIRNKPVKVITILFSTKAGLKFVQRIIDEHVKIPKAKELSNVLSKITLLLVQYEDFRVLINRDGRVNDQTILELVKNPTEFPFESIHLIDWPQVKDTNLASMIADALIQRGKFDLFPYSLKSPAVAERINWDLLDPILLKESRSLVDEALQADLMETLHRNSLLIYRGVSNTSFLEDVLSSSLRIALSCLGKKDDYFSRSAAANFIIAAFNQPLVFDTMQTLMERGLLHKLISMLENPDLPFTFSILVLLNSIIQSPVIKSVKEPVDEHSFALISRSAFGFGWEAILAYKLLCKLIDDSLIIPTLNINNEMERIVNNDTFPNYECLGIDWKQQMVSNNGLLRQGECNYCRDTLARQQYCLSIIAKKDESLEKELYTAKIAFDELTIGNGELMKQVDSLQNDLSLVQQQSSDLKATLIETNRMHQVYIDENQVNVDEKDAIIQQLKSENGELQQKLSIINDKAEQRSRAFESEKEELKNYISQREIEYQQALSQQCEKLQAESTEIIGNMTVDFKNLTKTLQDKELVLTELQQSYKSKQTQDRLEASKIISDLESQTNELFQQVTDLKNTISMTKAKEEGLIAQIEQLQAMARQKDSTITRLKNDLEQCGNVLSKESGQPDKHNAGSHPLEFDENEDLSNILATLIEE